VRFETALKRIQKVVVKVVELFVVVCWRRIESEDPSVIVHTTYTQRLFFVVMYVTFRATYSIVVTFTVFALLIRHVNRCVLPWHSIIYKKPSYIVDKEPIARRSML